MKNYVKLFVILISIFLLYDCESNVEPNDNDEIASTHFTLKLSIAEVQTEVDSIYGKLERTGYSTIERSFTISGDSANADFGDIVSGTWHLSVSAFDSIGTKIYFGETDVTITAGQITVVNLTLDPLTGGLVVNVKWGINNTGEFIYLVGSEYGNNIMDIYRYNIKTSLLERITENEGIYYITYLKDQNKIGYSKRYTNEFWLVEPNGTNKQFKFSYPEQMYRPDYCSVNNMIYYYVIPNYRRITSINIDGSNNSYLTDAANFNNWIPVVNSTSNKMLFQSDSGGTYNIYMMDFVNNEKYKLTDYSVNSEEPRWSKKNNGFYFIKNSTPQTRHIYYYNLNNSSIDQIFTIDSVYTLYYDVSENDEKLALLCSKTSSLEKPYQLYIYDISTGVLEQKTFANISFGTPRWINIKK